MDPRVVLWNRCPRGEGRQVTVVLGWELQGSGGAGLGVEGRGVARGAPSIAPTPGMQEGGWAAGPRLRAVPTVSVSCTSRQHPQRARSLSPPTWRSCSGRCFPQYPCRRHRPSKFSLYLWRQVDTCLSRDAGAQDRQALSVNAVCPKSCLNSPVEWTLCLHHATETNTSSLGAVS